MCACSAADNQQSASNLGQGRFLFFEPAKLLCFFYIDKMEF